ncbi:hypothetical protein EP073_11515 [Geovibrio thiophilus]|uniref:Molecular chaperone TorD n=1 Tax=Geovibrio thiophilus TaxID=139438 RepID=A0A3R5XYQ2_9BACT|nr:molecular chaperone TorD family protein [Geovibrio thiophilus]QAR34009.1 hypothetical protein EP073_11515 [Geovibrio thiophilus]
MEQTINLKDIVGLRSRMYSFLSRAYTRETDVAYLQQIISFIPVLRKLGENTSDEMYLKGVEKLIERISSIKDENEYIEELARKFATIFLNVSPNNVIPHAHPYESVYLSSNKLVMQEQRDEVIEFYAKHNIGIGKDFKEPEDHIAVELSFLSMLNEQVFNAILENEMAEVQGKLEAHKIFMEKHLMKWVHLFGNDLRKADYDGFYNAFADLTMGFIRIDYKFLVNLISYSNE